MYKVFSDICDVRLEACLLTEGSSQEEWKKFYETLRNFERDLYKHSLILSKESYDGLRKVVKEIYGYALKIGQVKHSKTGFFYDHQHVQGILDELPKYIERYTEMLDKVRDEFRVELGFEQACKESSE